MGNFKTFFVEKEEVEGLQKSLIGVVCKNACNGSGVMISQGAFIDCTCQKEFQNKVKFLVANIPKKYWDFTLRNLTKEFTEENKNSLLLLQQYREKLDMVIKEGIGLYIQGQVGLAKSALSYHLLKFAIGKGVVCYGIRMSQLTKLIFDSLKESKYREQLDWIKREVQLLLIDEIEKDYKIHDLSQFAAVQVNEFLGVLYEQKKSLIVTSNLSKQGLKGIHVSNIIDRLEELIDAVFTGHSYRRQDASLKKLFE